ncbi:MAG: S8 family serine peptidase [Saprospiraceae bacterium]|nr:S8 family serine peptidase [Saprospiraceae bacterium]
MKNFLKNFFFIAFLCCTSFVTHAQVNFDLVIIFKPATTWADITTFKAQLRATQLDSTLPSGAKLWRCSIPTGTVITLPNAPSLGGVSSGTVNKESDAVGVICNIGSSDGVSLNGLYVIREGDQKVKGDTSQFMPPALFGSCPSPATDSVMTVTRGDRALKIAILDSGIDADSSRTAITIAHDSIRPFIDAAIGYDFVNNSIFPKDSTGHGTFVAGVISRILKRNQATNIKILVVKVLNRLNRGYEYDIIRGIDFALRNKVEVINCSFISSTPLADTSDSPLTSAINTARLYGVLVSIAAGNNGKDIDQAANLFGAAVFQNPNIIVTGAISCFDSTAVFSNFAKRNVDIMTPARNMVSTWIRTPVCSTSTCYAIHSGTSFAAPQTTAVAALLSSRLISPDWQRVKCAIMKGSTYRPFLLNKSRRSSTLNGISASNIWALTNTPCDDLVNATDRVLENITTFRASPNPFTTGVTIDFSLNETAVVLLSIFNSMGQRLVNQAFTAYSGENNYPLSINASAGVYIVQIQVGKDIITQKIVKF